MPQPLYVLGHRNPDSDAICAAIGYAALLQAQGRPGARAARQGALRPETEYILQRFGVEAPPLVTDVRPCVADAMTSPVVSVSPNASLLEVGHVLRDQDLRVVAVTEQGRLIGVCGIADLAGAFIQLDELNHAKLDFVNITRTLGGTVLVDAPERPFGSRVMVAAMNVDAMVKRLRPGDVLVVGDRAEAQRAAIRCRVSCLIVTGDDPVAPDVVELAAQAGVRILVVPHHTFATLRLIQLSSPVHTVMTRDVATCSPDDLVEDAREQLREGQTRSLIVIDDDGMVEGIVSRSTLLRAVRREVALVDHNERGQAVIGINEAEIVAVIDHHRVADFWTRTPPYMRFEPVGATSTIVAKLFMEAGLRVPAPIAGVLLSAILTDTLLFRGPTTTPEDRRVAAFLADVASVDPVELGEQILSIASDVSDRSARDLLLADYKEFQSDGHRFGIGTLETTNAGPLLARHGEILDAMGGMSGFSVIMFAIIDIVHERTTILTSGHAAAIAEAFGGERNDAHVVCLQGIASRKKTLVPHLGSIAAAIGPPS